MQTSRSKVPPPPWLYLVYPAVQGEGNMAPHEKTGTSFVNEVVDEAFARIRKECDTLAREGFSIAILVHAYDPMAQQATYKADMIGDRFALKAACEDWLEAEEEEEDQDD